MVTSKIPGGAERAEDADHTGMLYIGVVNGGRDVLWIGAAATRSELAAELVDFLVPRSDYQLREGDGRQFRRLLEQGQAERAVDLYFATVGNRWDFERLSIVTRPMNVGRVPHDSGTRDQRELLRAVRDATVAMTAGRSPVTPARRNGTAW